MTKTHKTPEITEYGAVTRITEGDGNNKAGEGDDEFSEGTGLTGSVGFGSDVGS